VVYLGKKPSSDVYNLTKWWPTMRSALSEILKIFIFPERVVVPKEMSD